MREARRRLCLQFRPFDEFRSSSRPLRCMNGLATDDSDVVPFRRYGRNPEDPPVSGQQMPDVPFSALLRELYEAAGSPDLATLTRQAKDQRPSLKLSDATLSDWFSGKSIPTKEP